MAKHKLYVASFTEREVDVPEKCPSCNANLSEAKAIIEWNWSDIGVYSHRGPEGTVEPDGRNEYASEAFWPETLSCAACNEEIVPDPETGSEGPPPYDAATATGMYDRDEG